MVVVNTKITNFQFYQNLIIRVIVRIIKIMKRRLKKLSTSLPNILIYSGGLLTFTILIILLVYNLGNSETLSCIKLEAQQISCQLEKSYWYGLELTPIEKFKLTKADIILIDKGDDITNEKLVLYDNDNRPIDFYEERQVIFFNDVESNKERISKFILEAEEKQTLKISSYGFIRVLKTSTEILLTFFLVFLPIFVHILRYRSELSKTNYKS